MQVQQTYNTLARETLLENDVESRRKTQLKVAKKGFGQIFGKSKRFWRPVHKSLTNGEKRVAFFYRLPAICSSRNCADHSDRGENT